MFGNAPLSPFTGVPGWETKAEQQTLMLYAAQVPNGGIIVEIGGEYGMSASLFAKAASEGVDIVTIDLFPGDLKARHISNLAEAGFKNCTHPIEGNSPEVAAKWPELTPGEELLDLLFIDGDHSYEGAAADIAGWIPYVKLGGTVIFHDATPPTNLTPHPLHHEVNRAIEEWIAKPGSDTWKELASVDTMRIFQLVEQGKPAPKPTTGSKGKAKG